jgi:hypothetical protein
LDVDLNVDSDFLDAGEMGYTTGTTIGSAATINVSPGLARGAYWLRARITDRAGNTGMSPNATVIVDSLRGDFDFDNNVGASDVDLLHAAIRDDSSNPFYDLTGNGVVGHEDVTFLVTSVLNTHYGDVNLDGLVDRADVAVMVINYGGILNVGWARGDVDGDGRVGLLDLVLLHQNFGATPTPTISGDLNGDGRVNRADVAMFLTDFGTTISTTLFSRDLNRDGEVSLVDLALIQSDLEHPVGGSSAAALSVLPSRAGSPAYPRMVEIDHLAGDTAGSNPVLLRASRSNAAAVDRLLMTDSGITPVHARSRAILRAARQPIIR